MSKSFRKLVLLACAVMALCAWAMPSMASAASWGPVSSTHTETGSLFTIHISFPFTLHYSCAHTHDHSEVASASVMTITSASFGNCTGAGAAAGCAVTLQATSLPWSATGVSTSNVTIDGVRIDGLLEGGSCAVAGASFTMTGNLQGGAWDPAAHQITYNNASGLTAHSAALGSGSVVATTTLRDLTQTLTLS